MAKESTRVGVLLSKDRGRAEWPWEMENQACPPPLLEPSPGSTSHPPSRVEGEWALDQGKQVPGSSSRGRPFSCSVARVTQGGDSYHRGPGVMGTSPRLLSAGATGLWVGPHRPLLLTLWPPGCSWAGGGGRQAGGEPPRHLTRPPSLPLKTEAQGSGQAEVSQLARGHLGLQCRSPDARIMSVCTPCQNPGGLPAF